MGKKYIYKRSENNIWFNRGKGMIWLYNISL